MHGDLRLHWQCVRSQVVSVNPVQDSDDALLVPIDQCACARSWGCSLVGFEPHVAWPMVNLADDVKVASVVNTASYKQLGCRRVYVFLGILHLNRVLGRRGMSDKHD